MPDLEHEQALIHQGYSWVAGIDEVGRGPLAGPVVAGAVVLSAELSAVPAWLEGVNDSKRLSPRQRERCLERINEHAVAIGVGMAGPAEIDQVGIGAATRRAMVRAIQNLPWFPEYLLIDYVSLNESGIPFLAVTGGDRRCYSIAAASIVAKVTRDRLMEQADVEYPSYGFARHKGYPTPEHLELLSRHGPSPIHRRSFSPLRPRLIQVEAAP